MYYAKFSSNWDSILCAIKKSLRRALSCPTPVLDPVTSRRIRLSNYYIWYVHMIYSQCTTSHSSQIGSRWPAGVTWISAHPYPRKYRFQCRQRMYVPMMKKRTHYYDILSYALIPEHPRGVIGSPIVSRAWSNFTWAWLEAYFGLYTTRSIWICLGIDRIIGWHAYSMYAKFCGQRGSATGDTVKRIKEWGWIKDPSLTVCVQQTRIWREKETGFNPDTLEEDAGMTISSNG